jgi:hypothetical protein
MYDKRQSDEIEEALDKVTDVRQIVANMSVGSNNQKFNEAIEDAVAYLDVMIQDMIEEILEKKSKQ